MRAIVHSDGGTRRKNPGKASYGYVILDRDGKGEIDHGYGLMGIATNNIAEYIGLINGLMAARRLGVKHLTARVDSQMLQGQVSGTWRCKNERLKPLLAQALCHIAFFESFRIEWVPRAKNKRADALCRVALAERWS